MGSSLTSSLLASSWHKPSFKLFKEGIYEALTVRWEDYSNVGQVIEETRFITFKVPLKEAIQVRAGMRFTPRMLLESLQEKQLELGLLIDLTNTERYYNRSEFEENSVAYAKIFVPGHVVPSDDIFQRFSHAVDTFLEDEDNNGYLVGIHCTHGVNRTGYMVCRYMIEKLGIEPDKAIEAYKIARGYPIERENYLSDLRERKPGQIQLGLVTNAEQGHTANPASCKSLDRSKSQHHQGKERLPTHSNRLNGGSDNFHQRRGGHNRDQNSTGYSGYRGNNHCHGNGQKYHRNQNRRLVNDNNFNRESGSSYNQTGYQEGNNSIWERNQFVEPRYYPQHNNQWRQYDQEHNPRNRRNQDWRRRPYGRQNSWN